MMDLERFNVISIRKCSIGIIPCCISFHALHPHHTCYYRFLYVHL
nr:MAG TPA: YSIRK type signal peptide [Crassvirales sp.]